MKKFIYKAFWFVLWLVLVLTVVICDLVVGVARMIAVVVKWLVIIFVGLAYIPAMIVVVLGPVYVFGALFRDMPVSSPWTWCAAWGILLTTLAVWAGAFFLICFLYDRYL